MDAANWIAILAIIAVIGIAVFGGLWRQTLQITKQFSDLKDFVNDKIQSVLTKLEYHEKHDDQRFTRISDDIWMLRLRYNVQGQRSERHQTPSEENQIGDIRRSEDSKRDL